MTLEEVKMLVLSLPEDERMALAEWIQTSADTDDLIDPTVEQVAASLHESLAEMKAGKTVSVHDMLDRVRDTMKRDDNGSSRDTKV
jgi:hypothetical protein